MTIPEFPENLSEVNLPPNSLKIAEKRGMRHDELGNPIETPTQMFWRVSYAIASKDAKYLEGATSKQKEAAVLKTAKDFYKLLTSISFFPGARVFYEAGNNHTGQLASCFVVPIEDSLEGIFDSLKNGAIIQKNNGGTGFNFSKLRPKSDFVKGVPGIACGPIHYLKTFHQAFSQLLQGSKRFGGNMGMLNVDHPDIFEFINLKGPKSKMKNFNLSVGVTDNFMEKVERKEEYDLVNPRTQKSDAKVNAYKIFETICRKAWESADPGLFFLDTAQRANPTPLLGVIDCTNPCGEEPLLPYESCNLGSIIVSNHVKEGSVDWDMLRSTVKRAVHFMDNMIDASEFPLDKVSEAVHRTRKIGIGIAGFAQALFRLGIPYDSQPALKFCEELMRFIEECCIEGSEGLAKERGVFPAFKGSKWDYLGRKVRNAAMTSIAPTGTLAILANCSFGIEPVFALVSKLRVLLQDDRDYYDTVDKAGETMLSIDPVFKEAAKRQGFYSRELMEEVAQTGTLEGIASIPEKVKKVFVTTHQIPYEYHVRIQAAAQKHVDAAVSKTINLPQEASVEDVKNAYMMAWKLGCKGITVYRDKSKAEQIVTSGVGKKIRIKEAES